MKRFIINPKGKVFITGATQYIGAAITKQLVSDNYEVLTLSRSDESDRKLFIAGSNPVRTDIMSLTNEDLEGCDQIIHTAVALKQVDKNENDFEKFCIEGTKNLIKAAKEAGVKKFIYIANENLYGHTENLNHIDENHKYFPESSDRTCTRIKQITEQIVLDANEEGVFETVSIRPRLIWGSNNSPLLQRLTILAEKKNIFWVDEGMHLSNFTHIDNLVSGVVLAMNKAKGANAYFITDDEVISYKVFFTQLLNNQKISFKGRTIPSWYKSPLIWFRKNISSTFSKENSCDFASYGIYFSSHNYTVSNEKARVELEYKPIISFKEGMVKL